MLLQEFRAEMSPFVPSVLTALETVRSKEKPEDIAPIREFLHRIAGVAAPCGLPYLSTLSRLAEDYAVMLLKGEVALSKPTIELFGKFIHAVVSQLESEAPAHEVDLPAPETINVVSPVSGTVLVVDDDPTSARIIRMLLDEAGYSTHHIRDSRDTLKALAKLQPDVVLLDLLMPMQSGFETCRQIRASWPDKQLPVIFLTRSDRVDTKVEALEGGADDYITKPFVPEELLARVKAQIAKHSRRSDEVLRDSLTGAWNQKHLRAVAARELARLVERGEPFCLTMLDVDFFKKVNDGHGHLAGDGVLKEVVRRATACVRQSDVVARYGGDEMSVVLLGASVDRAAPVLERLVESMRNEPIALPSSSMLTLTISAGLTQAHASDSVETLIERADQALYQAKRDGRNRLVIHRVEK